MAWKKVQYQDGKFRTTDDSGGGSSGHNYSTTEQVIGTWIDGKPLYEKTLDFSSSPKTLTRNSWTRLGISDLDIKTIVDVTAINDAGDCFKMLAGSKGSYSDTEILNGLTSRDITAYFIVLQYTKTTD